MYCEILYEGKAFTLIQRFKDPIDYVVCYHLKYTNSQSTLHGCIIPSIHTRHFIDRSGITYIQWHQGHYFDNFFEAVDYLRSMEA